MCTVQCTKLCGYYIAGGVQLHRNHPRDQPDVVVVKAVSDTLIQ